MYSNDIKIRAIRLYRLFNSYRYVGYLLNIGKSTIHRWINDRIPTSNKNDIFLNNRENIIKFIKKLLNDNKFIAVKNIRKNVHTKFGILFSISFIYNIITRTLKYSYKKVNNKLYNKSIDALKNKQKKFLDRISNIDFNKVICIDETYLHSNSSKNYGWSKNWNSNNAL